ncbi:16S rRNA (cytosine(967)-C(5))-methyltransferase RsmB [Methylophilus medardicus]|uniref:16S rRNA (cytosine(967)-C(5))-methyltransferase n=1 Tax=Methylophilus medardicus TaxID=2588534 RepID=A0A5B8CVE0_9PROT|nr:16S rRNA (cytosine(967)-C(5))-methyltransferase RsmB [Methylophilus medardicus]QDC45262.1 16S rRNA (cytosine(967)-C(5))-methyltransferase RsmB [Methylophilus medardicus]QDC50269.1 16S rRNA (cytosine(967)-C(5))-methyltransferase RsmB [Methylophilus medardicus]QDC53974.1 16S rRNA (cytosine(967)-C(5))-methyltransferase RsmB [Methylophilus medardicus]
MQVAQLIAAYAVAEVLAGHNLTVSMPKALRKVKSATPQQQAAAQDYSYLTLRFYAESAAYLQALTPKPVTDDRVSALLLVALSQLLHQDDDDFTVVNQAVEAAGKTGQRWAKSLVNAVLRNFLRQRAQLQTTIAQREEVQFNYPQWWINTLKQQYPQDWQAILEVGNSHPPMTLRVNLRKTDVASYLKLLADAEMSASHLGGTAIQLHSPVPVHQLPNFEAGWVSVQDTAAQWAAPLLDLQAGMRVLDACSAPGGKSCHILEACEVELWSLDMAVERQRRVHENLQRLGLQAHVVTGDAANTDWFDGQLFDRILADVPCSASGIVRRHVDMKWLRRPQDLATFAHLQQEILSNLWQTLAKGGKLLYVTCSIFPQENDMQIQQFLSAHADATRLPIAFDPAILPCQHHIGGQMLPTAVHDGLFYALLQKH